jgi:geranylgeranylglycerol-phosphate geranylgeranyltransferase
LNKPHRVLPQGKISLKHAYHFALFLFILGISMSFFTGKAINVAIAIFNSLLLFYYAKKFKMKFLSGNLIVAFTSASTFLYGGITNSNVDASLFVAGFAFFYTIMREIVKDMEDKPADETYHATTLPVRFGIKKAIAALFVPAVCIFLYSVWYFLFFSKNVISFLLFFLLVIIPLFAMIFFLKKKPQVSSFKSVSGFMKADMLVLLIILTLG